MNITDVRGQLPRRGTQDSAHGIGEIAKIIVHHDAQFRPEAYDDMTRLSQQANYHIGQGEDGLQYHYSISNLGDIFWCRTLTDTLWHCGNYSINRTSIAIKLDGNMQDQQPTQQQLQALQELLDHLCTQHPEFPADQDDVLGHREVASTACPGNNLIDDVLKYRTTGKIVDTRVEPNPPVVQDPPTTKLYRVYDVTGKQVGAYSVLANAQTKLNTLEAGVIKDSDGKVVAEKVKPAPTPPQTPTEDKKGDPVVDVPVETPKPVEVTPTVPETPPVTLRPTLWDWVVGLFNQIVDFLKSYKKGGE